MIRVHLRGTFVVSRPACRHWRAQAKEHGTTYGRLINTATGLLALRRRGPVELRRGEGGHQRVHRGGRDRDGAVRRDRQHDHARREHAARADRLADGARRSTQAGGDAGGFDPRDPVHVAEFGCFLASPEAAGSPARRSRSTAARSSTWSTWRVEQTWHRDDRGFTADELAAELPLDAGPKPPTAPRPSGPPPATAPPSPNA